MKQNINFIRFPKSFLKEAFQSRSFEFFYQSSLGSVEPFSSLHLRKNDSQLLVHRQHKQSMINVIGERGGELGEGFNLEQQQSLKHLLEDILDISLLETMTLLPKHLQQRLADAHGSLHHSLDFIAQNAAGVALLLRLFASHDYLIQHSLIVASLSFHAIQEQDLSKEIKRDILIGALLHDIGMLRIDENLYVKPKLNSDDRQLMEEHPLIGRKILKNLPHLENLSLKIIAGHHIQANGRGYGESGCPEAMMVGSLDAFATMIIPTPYRLKPFSCQEALERMKNDEGHFDLETMKLISKLFLYAPFKKAG